MGTYLANSKLFRLSREPAFIRFSLSAAFSEGSKLFRSFRAFALLASAEALIV